MNSTTMTVRLDPDAKNRLARLAEITHRSKSFLASEAINEYIKIQEWQMAEIEKGISEADAGLLVEHDTILKLWGKKRK